MGCGHVISATEREDRKRPVHHFTGSKGQDLSEILCSGTQSCFSVHILRGRGDAGVEVLPQRALRNQNLK